MNRSTHNDQAMEAMVRKLIDDGWREYPDGMRKYARCFYKRFDTLTRCRCNDDQAGMQVCCAVSEFQGRVSYELDLCGKLPDGTWIKLHQWAMPADIGKGLAVIPRMLATWEHVAGDRVQVFVSNDSGDHGVAGAASVWAAATRDRDEARVANAPREGRAVARTLDADVGGKDQA